MDKKYQKPRQNSKKQPVLEYSIPLSEQEWQSLLHWVEQNYSGRKQQSVKEEKNEA